jgi:hypothetical protein
VNQSNLKKRRKAGFAALALAAAMVTGCSRQLGVPQSDLDATLHSLPFQQISNQRGISPTGSLASTVVPAGTLIAIRLQSILSSAASHSGDPFTGVLDEPIVIDGQTIAQQGTAVTGRVVEAMAADRLDDPGYLRLILTTITVHGKPLLLQSSSVFVKGGPVRRGSTQKGKPTISAASYVSAKQDVGFTPERQLTFRLIQPLSF